MANAVTLWPPTSPAVGRFISDRRAGLISTLYGASLAGGLSPAFIESQRQALALLAKRNGSRVLWNPMPEWDQAGGIWVPNGRPRYLGLTKSQAYTRFSTYYFQACTPLSTYLTQSAAQRGCELAAVTDYPANTFYAYANGVDVCLLERGIDELSDISTGIAFIRGAARQYNKRWGIDIANWRTSNNAPTQFTPQGGLTGGWSPSYLRRHYYIAYMSGAHILQNQAAIYYFNDGSLNPLGQATKEFADFALTRHPDVGRPLVNLALLVDYYSGFDVRYGVYNQAAAVWYRDIPYSPGDHMIDNVLKAAYPGHWLHGLTPGAPFANARGVPDTALFRQYLAAGGDPRPYEPMGTTRWGDNLDILADNASLPALQAYRAIALVGDVNITPQLRADLKTWVTNGGVLIMNAAQMSAADQELGGIALTGASLRGSSSRWLADNVTVAEPPFIYAGVKILSASVLATNGGGDPLVTLNRVGAGSVLVTTPRYLQSSAKDRLLAVGTRLFDEVYAMTARVFVNGPPVEYMVNQTQEGNLILTLVNNSGNTWNGSFRASLPNVPFRVREYSGDTTIPYTASGTQLTVAVSVPAYDLGIFAIELTGAAKVKKPAHRAVSNALGDVRR